jgi:hypothetical protein
MPMDTVMAQKIMDETNAKIKVLEAEMEQLTGKDNKKARNAKSREVSDMKKTDDFVDAERVIAGKEPLQEKWKGEAKVEKKEEIVLEVVDKTAYVAPTTITKDKKEKKEKKPESAGISPAERDELEKLKVEIVAKKTALKEQGLSGGQQNKDPDVVKMVTRMQELKVKSGEISGDAKADKKAAKGKGPKGNPEEIQKLTQEIEDYKLKLKTEFGYTKNDIAKDEDILEMQKRLKAMGN